MSEREFKRPERSDRKQAKFIRPSDLHKNGITGVILEGEFVEALTNPFDNSKQDYKFVTEDGETVILNSAGGLAYQMEVINPGTYCQVHYHGKELLTKGKMKGREAHNFEVLVG
jgi:hypothetical protein